MSKPNEPRNTRRSFLRHTGTTAVAVSATSLAARSASAQATETIGLGFIGVGGRGNSHLTGFGSRADCRVLGICDVNSETAANAKRWVKEKQGYDCDTYDDMRKMLDDKNIDAVVIATPDHWHCLAAIWACQSGKDVYVEKPVSNNPWEGRQLVKAARKYKRIVQVGTQNRSAPYNLEAKAYLDAGKLGEVTMVRVYNQKYFPPVKLREDGDAPDHLNWDVWQGPAPAKPFNYDRWRRWDEFWDYGGGDVTDDTVHQLDLACMLTNIRSYPKSVHSVGFRREGSDSQMPDTMTTMFEFDDKVMSFHQTLNTPYMLKTDGGIRNGDIFPHWPQNATRIELFGTKGLMIVGRHGGGWQVFGRPKSRKPVVVEEKFGRFPDADHKQNFVDCIRSRELPNADVELGHFSAAMCHFANISFRVQNRPLAIDGDTERFVGDEEANKLLRPKYRAPYVIEDEV